MGSEKFSLGESIGNTHGGTDTLVAKVDEGARPHEQLTPGLFGTEFNPKSELFGLMCGQMRGMKIIHNAGWYNRKGYKLGWGDLANYDFRRIAEEIQENEHFVILDEEHSFWEFVHAPQVIGSMAEVVPWIDKPGSQYVLKHARFIIARNRLYTLEPRREKTWTIDGVEFDVISRAQAAQILRFKFYIITSEPS